MGPSGEVVVLLPAHAGTFITPCPLQENGTVKKAIAQMTQSLLLSLAARSQLQELREKLRSPAMDKGPILKAKPPAAQKDILGVCCDPLVLAQQLTHIELVSAAVPPSQDGAGGALTDAVGHWTLGMFLNIVLHGVSPASQTGVSGEAHLLAPTTASGRCPLEQCVSLCLGPQDQGSAMLMGGAGATGTTEVPG